MNVGVTLQFPVVTSGSGTLQLSDALDAGDVTPATLPVDNAAAGFTPVIYMSIYNGGAATISFGTTTPGFVVTKSTGFAGATTCELDVYANQGKGGAGLTWIASTATGTVSGTSVTVNSVTLPAGNSIDIKPGQQVIAISCK